MGSCNIIRLHDIVKVLESRYGNEALDVEITIISRKVQEFHQKLTGEKGDGVSEFSITNLLSIPLREEILVLPPDEEISVLKIAKYCGHQLGEKYRLMMQDICCKRAGPAFNFARTIPWANIRNLEEKAVGLDYFAKMFATDVEEANIEYCYKFASQSSRKEIAAWVIGLL